MDPKKSSQIGSSVSVNDLNHGSILWNKEGKRLNDLLASDLRNSGDRSYLVKAHCKRQMCECALRNHKSLLLKASYDVHFVYATWNKQKSVLDWKTNAPMVEKQAQLILPQCYIGWFEIINENHQAIPCWTNVKDVVRFKPQSFIVRKDMRVFIPKQFNSQSPPSYTHDLSITQPIVVKTGTVLHYVEYRKYNMSKSRNKVKEVPLIHTRDDEGRHLFLSLEEKCMLSPIAGKDNISGVHTLSSIIHKFHAPVNVHPLFQPPMAGLALTDKHFLRITEMFRGNLLFLAALDNPDRFFVVTASMLDDHNFFLGESTQPTHFHALEKHSKRVETFLSTSHAQDSLRYLFKHLQNIKYVQKQQTNGVVRNGSNSSSTSGSNKEFDQLYIDVDEIYYFIRTGHYPTPRTRSESQPPPNPPPTTSPPIPERPIPRPRQSRAQTDPTEKYASIPRQDQPVSNSFKNKKRSSSCDNLLEATSRSKTDNDDKAMTSYPNSHRKINQMQDMNGRLHKVLEHEEDLYEIDDSVHMDQGDTRAEISQVIRRQGVSGSSAAVQRSARRSRRYTTDCSPLMYQRKNPALYCSYENL